jgi:hypothetical protein
VLFVGWVLATSLFLRFRLIAASISRHGPAPDTRLQGTSQQTQLNSALTEPAKDPLVRSGFAPSSKPFARESLHTRHIARESQRIGWRTTQRCGQPYPIRVSNMRLQYASWLYAFRSRGISRNAFSRSTALRSSLLKNADTPWCDRPRSGMENRCHKQSAKQAPFSQALTASPRSAPRRVVIEAPDLPFHILACEATAIGRRHQRLNGEALVQRRERSAAVGEDPVDVGYFWPTPLKNQREDCPCSVRAYSM